MVTHPGELAPKRLLLGFEVFVNPVASVSPLAVEARPEQQLHVSCVAGCTTATRLHLAASSCGTARGALLRSPQRLGLAQAALAGSEWTVQLDASGFAPGSSLLLCADVDGSGAGREAKRDGAGSLGEVA